MFIVFEGPEGSGKTTQIKLLANHFKKIGQEFVLTREPGGTKVGKILRKLLQNPDIPLNHRAELLLFEADRAQHIEELIKPALQNGKIVLSDRFSGSTIAYQYFARKIISWDDLWFIDTWARGGLQPNLYILLDIDVKAGLSRDKSKTRFEKEKIEFHQKLRKGYLEIAKKNKQIWRIIDTNKKNIDEVHREVLEIIEIFLNKTR